MKSRLPSGQYRHIGPECCERSPRVLHSTHALSSYPKVLLGSAAALRRRLANRRCDQARCFKTIQGSVNSAKEHNTTRHVFDLPRYPHAVRVLFQTKHCKKQHQLEVRQERSAHLYTNSEQIE